MPDDTTLEQFLARVAGVNPFLDNRVNGPAPAGQDVVEVHRAAFDRLTSLAHEAREAGRGLGAVLWGEAGIGKSHLLARLQRWAAQEGAYLVYLHNLQAAPDALPRSLVNAVVSSLSSGRRSHFVVTPLYNLARAGVVEAAGGVGTFTWRQLEHDHADWLDRLGPSGGDRLMQEVLFRFFQSAARAGQGKHDNGVAGLAVRWLAGQALDPAEARQLGLPPGRHRDDPQALEDAQQLKQVLVALSRLALAHGRPCILALDQVDNLDPEQFSALARFLEAVLDQANNLLVVTVGVRPSLDRWRQEGVVQKSAWDRIGQFEIALLPLPPAQAQRLVQARLDDFLAPFADQGAVQARRRDDDLFPLGKAWSHRHLLSRIEVRPRDVISLAREGWRHEQRALERAGGETWLASWPHDQASLDDVGPALTPEQEQALLDQEVDREMQAVRARLLAEPAERPPDSDRLASLVFDLLQQCRTSGSIPDLGQVDRLPPPRPGASPTYHLQVQMLTPAGNRTTGLLVLTARNATSAAGFLRRLLEDARPLDRVLLVTDARVGLPLGERGLEYLTALRGQARPELIETELSYADVVDLEALHAVVGRACSGDVELDLHGGRRRPVTAEEVIASHARRGRYLASRLLRELIGAQPVVLQEG
jgi:type II secretory pathway predicted ATPase ExeA